MSDRVALIVGAGQEAGQAAARQLARLKFRVALNDLLPTSIEPLAAELAAAGGNVVVYLADLTRKLALQTVLQSILEASGRIDVLVFLPSTRPHDSILDMDEWDWHRTLDANLTAAFLCMQSVGRIMRELSGGVIINVITEDQSSAVYAAAAAGLRALSAAAARDFSAHGIAVHVVSTATDIVDLLATQGTT